MSPTSFCIRSALRSIAVSSVACCSSVGSDEGSSSSPTLVRTAVSGVPQLVGDRRQEVGPQLLQLLERDARVPARPALERPRSERRRDVPPVFAIAPADPDEAAPGEITEQRVREARGGGDAGGPESLVELGRGHRGRHELDCRPQERIARGRVRNVGGVRGGRRCHAAEDSGPA